MKKIYFSFLVYISILQTYADLKNDMLPSTDTVWVVWEWLDPLTQILVHTKTFLFAVLWLVAVGVFLYFWFQLITNKWNEEEFKKALMWFIYAIVWLAIIPLAWWAVKIISTLTF
jgi:hypothetical protein